MHSTWSSTQLVDAENINLPNHKLRGPSQLKRCVFKYNNE